MPIEGINRLKFVDLFCLEPYKKIIFETIEKIKNKDKDLLTTIDNISKFKYDKRFEFTLDFKIIDCENIPSKK